VPITLFGLVYLVRLGVKLGDIEGAVARERDVQAAREAFATPGDEGARP
jgi:hypothetical protein